MEKIKNIVILGAGNVATHLARILDAKGFTILQIYSRNLQHAQVLADEIGCYSCNDLNWLNKNADLYIFAVKDDAIYDIATHISLPGKMVVHTSGAKDDSILARVSGNYGVFYPLQTFSKSRNINWAEIPVCIEANNLANLKLLSELAYSISEKVIETNFHQRRILHLAAVFVNNFSNHLLANAYMLMAENALAFDILKPLALETIQKAFEIGPQNSQTGPAIRGDVSTLKAHRNLLKDNPEALAIYKSLTKSIRNTQSE